MPVRARSTYDQVLLAIESQLISAVPLNASQVVMSLDETMGDKDPPGDKFAVISPGRLPMNQPAITGGGSDVLLCEATTRIYLWLRLELDPDRYDRDILVSSGGILAFFNAVMTAFNPNGTLFDPTQPSNPDNFVLAQPMRLLSPNFRARRIGSDWVRVATEWESYFLWDVFS